jgi:Cadherin domain
LTFLCDSFDVKKSARQWKITYKYILYREYNATILNTESVGEEVLMVGARDRDSSIYGQISYSITAGNREGFFNINRQTGLITVASSLANAQGKTDALIVAKISPVKHRN